MIFGAMPFGGCGVIVSIVCLITVSCKQYKKMLSHAKAQNEQLEHEVINMESQGNILHGKIIPG